MELTLLVLLNIVYIAANLPQPVDKRLLLNINEAVEVGIVDDKHLDEASGACGSRLHPGIFYSHNNHGGHNRLFAINGSNAHVVSVITINRANNNDWEDLACGKCYGHLNDFCIYIGDIGDGGDGSAQTVYRVVEPTTLTDHTFSIDVDGVLKYSWTEVNAETLMVAPNADLYIVSNADDADSQIGLLPKEAWAQTSHVPITQMGPLSGITTTHHDPVGGDISSDGVLGGIPSLVPYKHEPQGQSVCFSVDGRSYYTTSEGVHEPFYRYDAHF